MTWKHVNENTPKDRPIQMFAPGGQFGLPDLQAIVTWHEDGGFCMDELRHPTHWKEVDPGPTMRERLLPERAAVHDAADVLRQSIERARRAGIEVTVQSQHETYAYVRTTGGFSPSDYNTVIIDRPTPEACKIEDF